MIHVSGAQSCIARPCSCQLGLVPGQFGRHPLAPLLSREEKQAEKHTVIQDYRQFPSRNTPDFRITGTSHPRDNLLLHRAACAPKRKTQKKGSPSATRADKKPLPSTLGSLLTSPCSRTTAAAVPPPTPSGNMSLGRTGKSESAAHSDAPPPRSPAGTPHTD